jgi:hypothetical protein
MYPEEEGKDITDSAQLHILRRGITLENIRGIIPHIPVPLSECECVYLKVLTYIEYRAVYGVFQNIEPPYPLHPARVSSPRTKGGGDALSPGG